MIHTAMRETGVDRKDTIMIGDTTYDIDMARAANVGALGVTWGYHHKDELTDAGAHLIIDEYTEMPAALARLFSEICAT